MESFFDQKDPDVALYETFKETFENENNGLIIGLANHRGIFNHVFLTKVEKATYSLQDIPEVSEVISPATLKEYIYAPLVRTVKIPVLHIDEPTKYESDEAKIYASHDYSRSFFSDDKTSVALLVRFDDNLNKCQSKVLLNKINKIISSFAFDDYRIAGRLQTQQYYIREMQKEMLLFSGLALFLFITSLYMIFRYWKLVFIALGIVTLAQIWLFGLIALLGISIDLMMVLLPSLIFILGTSISIHTLTHFQSEFRFDNDKIMAIEKAVSETGVPNFLNSFTTSVGFISLVFIPVLPLQRFGLFAASGIIITYIIGILLIPIALNILKIMPARRLLKSKNIMFSPREVILSLLSSKKFSVLALFIVMIIGGIYYSSRVQINNFFLDDLNASSSLKKDLMFFEHQFSGIKPIEILVHLREAHSSIIDYQSIIEMDLAETFLTSNFKTGFIISPVIYIKTINKAMHGGDSKMYRLPETEKQMSRVLKIAEKQRVWNRQIPILKEDEGFARISFRTTDAGSIENSKVERL
jgi:predicted RND superfamily exporter protein